MWAPRVKLSNDGEYKPHKSVKALYFEKLHVFGLVGLYQNVVSLYQIFSILEKYIEYIGDRKFTN